LEKEDDEYQKRKEFEIKKASERQTKEVGGMSEKLVYVQHTEVNKPSYGLIMSRHHCFALGFNSCGLGTTAAPRFQ
jgi:hypothetical protein